MKYVIFSLVPDARKCVCLCAIFAAHPFCGTAFRICIEVQRSPRAPSDQVDLAHEHSSVPQPAMICFLKAVLLTVAAARKR